MSKNLVIKKNLKNIKWIIIEFLIVVVIGSVFLFFINSPQLATIVLIIILGDAIKCIFKIFQPLVEISNNRLRIRDMRNINVRISDITQVKQAGSMLEFTVSSGLGLKFFLDPRERYTDQVLNYLLSVGVLDNRNLLQKDWIEDTTQVFSD